MARRDQAGLFSELPEATRRGGRRSSYFFALWPDAAVRRRLASASAGLPLGEGGAAYRIKPERLHLTLAWLGEIGRYQVDAAILAAEDVQARSFLLRLDRSGHFPNASTAWFGPSKLSPALARLKAELDRELLRYGLPVASEAFVPHVSCQRNVRTLAGTAPFEVLWPVTGFALLRSARSNGKADGYRLVRRWSFDGAAAGSRDA